MGPVDRASADGGRQVPDRVDGVGDVGPLLRVGQVTARSLPPLVRGILDELVNVSDFDNGLDGWFIRDDFALCAQAGWERVDSRDPCCEAGPLLTLFRLASIGISVSACAA
jgi:hypothetical protein